MADLLLTLSLTLPRRYYYFLPSGEETEAQVVKDPGCSHIARG